MRPEPVADALASEKQPPDVAKFVDYVHSGKPGAHSYAVLLGLRQLGSAQLLRQVEKGIEYASLERFQRNLDLPASSFLELVQIPQRTLTRRKKEGRLSPDESDRLLRAGRLFGRAIELFEGDVDAARKWLTSAQALLGGAVPLELAKSDLGAREVEAAIGRLEHGVFA